MRVLLIIDSLSSGGAQNQMVNLCESLSRRNVEVDLLTYYNFDFFEDRINDLENVNRIRIKKKSKIGLEIIKGIRKLLKSNKYDIALSYLDTPNFYLSMANFLSFTKCKIFISYRNSTVFKFSGRLLIKIASHAFSNKIIYNSYHERDAWMNFLPMCKNKMVTIYNGIDTKRFEYKSNRKFDQNKLISVSSVIPRKNVLFIVKALSILKSKYNRKVSYHWIGSHVEKKGNVNQYFNEVQRLLKDLKIADQWNWETPTKKIEDHYYNADALILASTREGVPNVLCEAMSTGLPVMASNLLDNPLLLSKNRGLLFDIKNPEELADKIEQFYTTRTEELTLRTKEASDFINNKMSIHSMENNYYNFFIESLKNENTRVSTDLF